MTRRRLEVVVPLPSVRLTHFWLELVPRPPDTSPAAVRAWRRACAGRAPGQMKAEQRLLAMYYGLAGPQRARPYTVRGTLVVFTARAQAQAVAAALRVRIRRHRVRMSVLVRQAGDIEAYLAKGGVPPLF